MRSYASALRPRAALFVAAAVSVSLAGSLDVPTPSVATDGPGVLGVFTEPLVSHERFAAADLGDLAPGDRIYGFSFRRDASVGTFAGSHFPRFDVRLGAAATTFDADFASNFAETPLLVRAGPLDLTPEHLPTGDGSPRPFGAAILFDTPFVYGGGDLLLEVRSGQPSVQVGIDTVGTLDGQPNSATNGYAVFHDGDVEAAAGNTIVARTNWPLRLHTLTAADAAGSGTAVRKLAVRGLAQATLMGPVHSEIARDDMALFLGEGAPLVGARVPPLGVKGSLDLGAVGTQVLDRLVRDDVRRIVPGAVVTLGDVKASFRGNATFSRMKVTVKAAVTVNGKKGSYRITVNGRLQP